MTALLDWLEHLLERAALAILLWFSGGPDVAWADA